MSKWQTLVNTDSYGSTEITERMAVPGGWLYRTRIWTQDSSRTRDETVAMVYVPLDGVRAANQDRNEWHAAIDNKPFPPPAGCKP